MKHYLHDRPVSVNDVMIDVIVFTFEGKSLYHPDIRIFSAEFGKIRYSTDTPERGPSYFSNEFESFAEASKIVEEQSKTDFMKM